MLELWLYIAANVWWVACYFGSIANGACYASGLGRQMGALWLGSMCGGYVVRVGVVASTSRVWLLSWGVGQVVRLFLAGMQLLVLCWLALHCSSNWCGEVVGVLLLWDNWLLAVTVEVEAVGLAWDAGLLSYNGSVLPLLGAVTAKLCGWLHSLALVLLAANMLQPFGHILVSIVERAPTHFLTQLRSMIGKNSVEGPKTPLAYPSNRRVKMARALGLLVIRYYSGLWFDRNSWHAHGLLF
ncbi:hypothetical protein U1Q18_017362 [Sarracenia purpurea var. burkii]